MAVIDVTRTTEILTLTAGTDTAEGVFAIEHVVCQAAGAGTFRVLDAAGNRVFRCVTTANKLTQVIPVNRTVNGLQVGTIPASASIDVYMRKG